MAHIVQQSITIQAPQEQVWDALTDPEKTRKYFFHARILSDWKPGNPIRFKGKMFWIIPFEMKGTILAIERGKRLQYELKNGKGSKATTSTVTVTLSSVNGVTTVSVSDDVGQGKGSLNRYKRSVTGWKKILHGLKKTAQE